MATFQAIRPPHPRGAGSSGPRILVVEDDEALSRALAGLLTSEGYDVATARDGQEGITLLATEPFDVILSDIKMPNMGGIEFLRESRTLRPFTPVILVTGFPTIALAVEGMKQGAFDFIHKPFKPAELQSVIGRALREKEQPRAKWVDREGTLLKEQIRHSLGKKIRELAALKNLGDEIRSLQGFTGAGGKVVKFLCDVFECREAALFLPSQGTRLLRLAASMGIVAEERRIRAALERLALWVACREETADVFDLVEIPAAVVRASPVQAGKKGRLPNGGPEEAIIIGDVLQAPYLAAQLHENGALKGIILLSGKREGAQFSQEDKDLMAAVAHQIASCIVKERLFAEIAEKNRRHEAELEMAQRVQRGILPKRMPQRRGIRIAGHCMPARRVGGDFYGFIETYDTTLRLYVGDVAGKGVPAALIMAMATNALTEYGKQYRDPEKILHEANASLRGHLEFGAGNYVTAFFGIVDLDKMELRYARAGHEPPLYYHSKDRRFEWLDARGHVLGLFTQAEYDPATVKIEPGDRLILFTDGVVEARNAINECFGEQKLKKVLSRCITEPPASIKDTVLARLEAWTQDLEPRDDLTLIAVEFGYQGWEERTLPSTVEAANRVKAEIYTYLRTLDLPPQLFEDFRFCAKEVFSNAIEHGNGNDGTKSIHAAWTVVDDTFWLRVRDEGEGFDPALLADPTMPQNACKLRGRGIYMLRALMDEVEWNDRGNEITIVKKLPADE